MFLAASCDPTLFLPPNGSPLPVSHESSCFSLLVSVVRSFFRLTFPTSSSLVHPVKSRLRLVVVHTLVSLPAMLRCQPSRLQLTSTDIGQFERRLSARKSQISVLDKAAARLSAGLDCDITKATASLLGRVDDHRNATLVSPARGPTDVSASDVKLLFAYPAPLLKASEPSSPTSPKMHLSFRAKAASALESILHHSLSPLKSSSRTIQDEKPRAESVDCPRDCPTRMVDNATWSSGGHASALANVPPSPRSHGLPTDHPHGLDIPTATPAGERRLLSSAHARRPKPRTQPQNAFPERQHLSHRSTDDLPRSSPTAAGHMALERPLHSRAMDHCAPTRGSLSLDPKAPIFTPRIKMGFAISVSEDDSTIPTRLPHSASMAELRTRSLAEQNGRVGTHTRAGSLVAVGPSTADYRQRSAPRSDRPPPTSSSDRNLPFRSDHQGLLPSLRPSNHIRDASSARAETNEERRHPSCDLLTPNAVPLETSRRSTGQTAGQTAGDEAERATSPLVNDKGQTSSDALLYNITAPSQRRQQNPLAWNRGPRRADHHQRHRVPSTTATEIGDMILDVFHPHAQNADAVTAFMNDASSPLEKLAADLKQMSRLLPPEEDNATNAGPMKTCVQLLRRSAFGDVTEDDLEEIARSYDHDSTFETIPPLRLRTTAARSMVESLASPLDSVPAPPSSFDFDAMLKRYERTPPTTTPSAKGKMRAPPSPSPHAVHPVDVFVSPGTKLATPRVQVYDDAKPAHAQPQTPADLHRSTRRDRLRSDSVMNPDGIDRHPADKPPPPTIPRRRYHRNTYPMATSDQASSSAAILPSEGTLPDRRIPGGRATGDTDTGGRMARSSASGPGSEETENDLEGQLDGLEEDRRVWVDRREGGGLDTTPPREGRFEKYLT